MSMNKCTPPLSGRSPVRKKCKTDTHSFRIPVLRTSYRPRRNTFQGPALEVQRTLNGASGISIQLSKGANCGLINARRLLKIDPTTTRRHCQLSREANPRLPASTYETPEPLAVDIEQGR